MNSSDQETAAQATARKHEAAHWVIPAIPTAIVMALVGWAIKQDASFQIWLITILSCVIVTLSYFVIVLFRGRRAALADVSRLSSFEKWATIEGETGLRSFSSSLENSPFHPSKLLIRSDIQSLKALGNGCSKWTSTGDHALELGASHCQAVNGKLQFLLQHPSALLNRGGAANEKKAKKNAKSALALRELQEKYPDTVEIKTYRHSAELRITIINEVDVTVGHYAAGAGGDSNKTPLLNFRDDKSNGWSFARAFVQHFDAEWKEAELITDWALIAAISRRGAP